MFMSVAIEGAPMAVPVHTGASVPVAAWPPGVARQLAGDAVGLVASATAATLARLEPLVRGWGLAPTQLPRVSAEPVTDGGAGVVVLRWAGDEQATVWPSLDARLLVLPGARGARVVLWTPRSPEAELATTRLDRVHRRRVVDLAVQRFLQELAGRLADPVRGPAGTTGTTFDRRPMFVHHVEALPIAADELAQALRRDPLAAATDATTAAREDLLTPLVAGRFRTAPDPRLRVRPIPEARGVLELAWHADEEATGWPDIALTVTVAASDVGSQLLISSPREPGYDLSLNRIDKQPRHDILQGIGAGVTRGLLASAAPSGPIVSRQRAPAAALR
jgi:hypothetical protein